MHMLEAIIYSTKFNYTVETCATKNNYLDTINDRYRRIAGKSNHSKTLYEILTSLLQRMPLISSSSNLDCVHSNLILHLTGTAAIIEILATNFFHYSYLARPFNFTLFPHAFRGMDKRFVCQSSSMHFLAKHNFDFNKLVYKGLTMNNTSLTLRLTFVIRASLSVQVPRGHRAEKRAGSANGEEDRCSFT